MIRVNSKILPSSSQTFIARLDGLANFETDIIPWKDPLAWLSANTDNIYCHAFSRSEGDELAKIHFRPTPIYQVNRTFCSLICRRI